MIDLTARATIRVAPVRGAEPGRECHRRQSYVCFGATRNATPVSFFVIPGRA